jgi:hypothetical protein
MASNLLGALRYCDDMDHLGVLRDKIGRFRGKSLTFRNRTSSFVGQSGTVPSPKSLADGGMNGYKQSSISLCNLQVSARELFQHNK